ncbi:MAG: hypothetical protein FJ090_02020 [Deltaproteobacteria bacterium]|nr:hypothetical protein [Deltaproteobacteria bacterium]MBM4389874.1 hypothetical protein [Deltaproteobacteria bacterium]
MVIFLLACAADELSQSWQVDRLRVLAVAAEPAEPRPGDTVTFSSLIVSPVEPLAGSAWFACSAELSSDYGCEVDPALLEGAEGGEIDPATLAEAGMIGFLPYLAPSWTVPGDYLDALDDDAKLEGTFGMVYIMAFPDKENVDEADIEVAYKRVPVSLATTPNDNPVVTALSIGGYVVPEGATIRVEPGKTYTLGYAMAEGSVETYAYRNSAGQDEEREEEPYATFYLQEGSFDQPYAVWPDAEVEFTAPGEPTLAAQSLWVVVRDRRGGMGWASITVVYGD